MIKWKKKRGKRARSRNLRDQSPERNNSPGCWVVEYECGRNKNFPPTSTDNIEEKVRLEGHSCSNPNCRPFWYKRIEEVDHVRLDKYA
jgi:hypothetical protein